MTLNEENARDACLASLAPLFNVEEWAAKVLSECSVKSCIKLKPFFAAFVPGGYEFCITE